MNFEIRREDYRSLPDYASVPISFDIHSIVDVASVRVGDAAFAMESVAVPTRKNYDALPGNDPHSWPRRFDVTRWIVLAAYSDGHRIGGAIVVADTAQSAQRAERPTLALLWDLRVGPAWRGRGVGRALIGAAEDAARRAGSCDIEVETQDNNVPACRLYAACGYTLSAVTPGAYSDAPSEARLVWSKSLGHASAPSG